MIRVTIVGQATDAEFPYRVEGHTIDQGVPLTGCARDPLFDACRMLNRMGEPRDHLIGLFSEGSDRWRMRTSVGYGSREPEVKMPYPAPYREFPGGPLIYPPGYDAGVPSAEAPATPPGTPAEPPPAPHTDPDQSDVEPKARPHHHTPATPGKSHHKPKPKGSGGRRSLSSGR